MPKGRDIVIKISRMLPDDTSFNLHENEVSKTQYLVKLCYARSNKAGERSERKMAFTRVRSHTETLPCGQITSPEERHKRTKTAKTSESSKKLFFICNQIKYKGSSIQREKICQKLYTSGFSIIGVDFFIV